MYTSREICRLLTGLFVSLLTLAESAQAQRVILAEDFEATPVGGFPAGWQDATAGPSPCGLPAAVVADVDPNGNATRALQIGEEVCRGSQGIYRRIGNRPRLSISLDVRIDQFSAGQGDRANDFPIFIALAQSVRCADPAEWRAKGIYVSSQTRTWVLWDSSGHQCTGGQGGIDQDLPIPAIEGEWYRIELEFDAAAGSLDWWIVNLSTGEAFPPVIGALGPPRAGLQDLLISDGEFSGRAPGNITLIDNILVVDETIPPPAEFVRGDSNADGTVNIADGVFTLGFLFAGNQAPPCLDAADTDDSGKIDIADSIATFNWLFLDGAAPSPPGPEACGEDPTDDALNCSDPECP